VSFFVLLDLTGCLSPTDPVRRIVFQEEFVGMKLGMGRERVGVDLGLWSCNEGIVNNGRWVARELSTMASANNPMSGSDEERETMRTDWMNGLMPG